MKLYRLICTNEYGQDDCNGYYLTLESAKKAVKITDEYPMNKKYNIKQHIEEIETIPDDEIF